MKYKKVQTLRVICTTGAFAVLIALLAGTAYSVRTTDRMADTAASEAASVSEAVLSEVEVQTAVSAAEVPKETRPTEAELEALAQQEAERERLGIPDGLSTYMETSMGTMLFYAQADPRWGDYLWGDEDRLDSYGCGPVVMAMVANAFGTQGNVTPVEMADWCNANGLRASHSGSYHSIVNTALTAYGLQVTSMSDRLNAETLREELRNGRVLVALVRQGYFTKGTGHFILIRGINEDGTVTVANPATLEHNTMSFDAELVIEELKTSASDAGGPLWSISR